MKAVLTFDNSDKMLSVSAKGLNIGVATPPVLTNVLKIKDYDTGWFCLDTNYGEEYLDFLGALETDNFPKELIKKFECILRKINIKDIELRCVK